MLHDVGKLHIPDRILLKPGPLDADEWALIRRHTIEGERILGSSDGFALARQVVRWHHENWDGSGYPDEIAGERIPFSARIVRIVDVFDALSTARPYKEAWPPDRVWDELLRQRGRLFDPGLVALFESLLVERVAPPEVAVHPVATVARLAPLD
jgi:putative two-component system response regulator